MRDNPLHVHWDRIVRLTSPEAITALYATSRQLHALSVAHMRRVLFAHGQHETAKVAERTFILLAWTALTRHPSVPGGRRPFRVPCGGCGMVFHAWRPPRHPFFRDGRPRCKACFPGACAALLPHFERAQDGLRMRCTTGTYQTQHLSDKVSAYVFLYKVRLESEARSLHLPRLLALLWGLRWKQQPTTSASEPTISTHSL